MIIKCESSGILFVSLSENLYPSDKLYPSGSITDPSRATFKVIDYFNFEDIRNNHTFESTTNYYDGETHKFLGDYLRYVRDYHGLNLMPYYNCFTDEYVNDLGLQKVQSYKVKSLFPDDNLYPSNNLYFERNEVDSESYKLTSNQGYRIASIPIKFNTTYTIAFDSTQGALIRATILQGEKQLTDANHNYFNNYEDLKNSYRYIPSTRFTEPFTYSVKTADSTLFRNENNLRLLIQLPNYQKTSIVVLEGDYTTANTIKTECITDSSSDSYSPRFLSLLQQNAKESYAFSDRLIEYLLDNVITKTTEFTDDIQRVQLALEQIDDDYKQLAFGKKVAYGVWDDYISKSIYNIVEKYALDNTIVDQDGNINKDVEQILSYKGVYRT